MSSFSHGPDFRSKANSVMSFRTNPAPRRRCSKTSSRHLAKSVEFWTPKGLTKARLTAKCEVESDVNDRCSRQRGLIVFLVSHRLKLHDARLWLGAQCPAGRVSRDPRNDITRRCRFACCCSVSIAFFKLRLSRKLQIWFGSSILFASPGLGKKVPRVSPERALRARDAALDAWIAGGRGTRALWTGERRDQCSFLAFRWHHTVRVC